MENTDTTAQIVALQDDNEALRAMIQRSASSSVAAAFRDASASEKLTFQYERVVEELKHEREARQRAQSMLNQTKDQYEVTLLRRDAEIKKLSDALKTSRLETEELKRKSAAIDTQLDNFKRENASMKEVLKRNNLHLDGASHAGSTFASSPPPQYKSSKPFSAVLRGLSPATGRHPIMSPPKSLTPRTTKQQPHDPTAPTRRGAYSTADPLRAASKSPTAVRSRPASTLPDLKSGAKVVWNNLSAVVRFIGTVHCLGNGTWVGVEVEPGKGEHNGTLGGVRYFVTEKRSAVFCKVSELGAARVTKGKGDKLKLAEHTDPMADETH